MDQNTKIAQLLNSNYTIGDALRHIPTLTMDMAGNATFPANVNMANLPTSSSGLSSGDLWNNSGVVNIV